jgi:branched-chain amino acid transport system ATP-binding protein
MTGQALLRTRGLRKAFLGFTAVDGVDLDFQAGRIHALIGPNGAGKTTCFNLLTKFLEPSAGQIHFDGRDITGLGPVAVARLGIVRSFQISSVFASLSVLDNLRVALQRPAGGSLQFWRHRSVLARHTERAMALLAEVGLADQAGQTAGSLPYGRKRALELATALTLDPKLLLLDEPTQGMGHEDVDQVMQLIRRIGQQRTVVMVEHNMKVVAGICDSVTVLARGRVIAHGSYAAVSQDREVRVAYLGEEAVA